MMLVEAHEMSNKTALPALTLSHALELLAGHVQSLSWQVGKYGFSFPGVPRVVVEIRSEPTSAVEGIIWDSVSLDGKWVGNRHAAVMAYTKHCMPTIEKLGRGEHVEWGCPEKVAA